MEGSSLPCGGRIQKRSASAGLILSRVGDPRFLDHVNRVRYVFADLITGAASEISLCFGYL